MSITIVRATHLLCIRGSRVPMSKMSNRFPQWEEDKKHHQASTSNHTLSGQPSPHRLVHDTHRLGGSRSQPRKPVKLV